MVHRYHTEVAKEYGLLEAIMFYHIAYWVRQNQLNRINMHHGRFWTYASVKKFSLRNGDALLAMSGATTGKVSILKYKNTDKYYQNQRVGYFERNIQYNYDFVSTIVRSDLFNLFRI